MSSARGSAKSFLPQSLLATLGVWVVPALATSAIETGGRLWMQLASVLLAMVLSVVAASAGSAIWARHPGSRDVVFGDLMLWGWLRKVRAERRLSDARELLGLDGGGAREGLSGERLCRILQSLGTQLEARDAYTHGHTKRVTRHSERIARGMGLSPAQVAKVRTAAALHDVGKVHTPREVLSKPGRLTDEEFALIQRHPVDGADMVAELNDPEVTAMVRHHHERIDGTGYPNQLSGKQIPLGARIIAVADTFDAMTSARPYRGASKHKKALDVISGEAGSQLDPAAVAAFQRYYTGRTSVAWSAFFVAAPQRALSWVAALFQGASAGSLPLAQGIAAMGAAALLGGSLGSQVAPAAAAFDTAASGQIAETQQSASGRAPANKRGKALKAAKDEARRKRAARRRSEPRAGAQPRKKPAGSSGPGREAGGNTQGGHPVGDGGSPGGSTPNSGSSGGGSGGSTGQPSAPLPDVKVPDVKLPDVEGPTVTTPQVQVPQVQVPQVQVPQVQVPQVSVPKLP